MKLPAEMPADPRGKNCPSPTKQARQARIKPSPTKQARLQTFFKSPSKEFADSEIRLPVLATSPKNVAQFQGFLIVWGLQICGSGSWGVPHDELGPYRNHSF